MGLFDGARDGTGSTADLAARLGLPVVLVVDARGQGASVAALAEGFSGHRRARGGRRRHPQPGGGGDARAVAAGCPRRALDRRARRRAARRGTEPALAPPRSRAGLRERATMAGQGCCGHRPRGGYRGTCGPRPSTSGHSDAAGCGDPALGPTDCGGPRYGLRLLLRRPDGGLAGCRRGGPAVLAAGGRGARSGRRRGLLAGRLPRAARGPHRGSAALSRRAARRGSARRRYLRRMRGLHGAGPGPHRRRRPAPRHGRAAAAGDQLSASVAFRSAIATLVWPRLAPSARREPAFAATNSTIAASSPKRRSSRCSRLAMRPARSSATPA